MDSQVENKKAKLAKFLDQIAKHPQLLNIESKMKEIVQNKNDKFIKFSQSLTQIMNSQLFQSLLTDIKEFRPIITIDENKPQIFFENKIFYEHLFHGENYSIILVMLPKGLQFTLHDHPEMLCIAKLLYGELEMESMDLQIEKEESQQGGKLKRLISQKLIQVTGKQIQKVSTSTLSNTSKIENQSNKSQLYTQSDKIASFKNLSKNKKSKVSDSQKIFNWNKSILKRNQINLTTPKKNNIHYFKALKDCIMIDFLSPDYESEKSFSYYEYVNGEIGSERYIRKIKKAKQQKYLTIISDFVGTDRQQHNE